MSLLGRGWEKFQGLALSALIFLGTGGTKEFLSSGQNRTVHEGRGEIREDPLRSEHSPHYIDRQVRVSGNDLGYTHPRIGGE